MKELTPLLEKLAAKLGTTVEMLWGVLLKQAPISGAVDLITCATLVWLAIWSFRFVQRKTTVPAATEDKRYPSAEWEGEGKLVAWLCVAAFACFVLICVGTSAQNIFAAFLNPQYWALEQILSKCK